MVVHPTILPFIATMTVKGKKTKFLRAYVAPLITMFLMRLRQLILLTP
jgi:hypothetical protein